MKLPKFLYNSLKTHATSLGNNDAFPPEKRFPFDYFIIKKRFNNVCRRLVELEGNDSLMNEDKLITNLTKYITKCKELEMPFKKALTEICINNVSEMFGVPDETVMINCELVGEIKPKHALRILPEEDEEYQFNDLTDFDNSNKVILKRRLINSLIQGAAYSYYNNAINDVYQLNSELPELYERIRTINDYLLFTKEEVIDDKHPRQGACVEVLLGREGEKTEINAQGILYPYLLTETIRGFLELFASHGLPKDNKKAEYIIKHADFLLAEPWDLRFGVELWELLAKDIEDTKLIPFFLSSLCELDTENFNSIIKEIFAKTKKGETYKNQLIKDAMHEKDMLSLVTSINTKNKEVEPLLNDEYMNDDDIENCIITEDDNEIYFEDSADADNVIVNEIDIHLRWNDYGAIPFAWYNNCNNETTLIIGENESTHSSVVEKAIINDVKLMIDKYGENANIKGTFCDAIHNIKYHFGECPRDEYMDDETGAIENDFDYENYLIDGYYHIFYDPCDEEWDEYSQCLNDCGRLWPQDKIIAFWSTPTPSDMKYLIYDLQQELNYTLYDFIYVYCDDNYKIKYCTIKEFISQNDDDYKYKPDDRTEIGNHLLPSNKKKETEQHKNFLNTRNEKNAEKLGDMTMAQYHSLIHQESKQNNKNIITEGLYDNFDITDADVILYKVCDVDEDNADLYYVIVYDMDGNIIYEEYDLYLHELEDILGNEISQMIADGVGNPYTNGLLRLTDFNSHEFGDVNETAKKLFKNNLTEYYPKLHGYIMQDGTCIDLEYDDHNIITKIPQINDKFEFIALGNIRCSDNFFDLIVEPTYAQEKALRKLIANSYDLSVDIFDSEDNMPLTSAMYYGKPDPSYVLNEIERYFNEGIKLQGGYDNYDYIDECFSYDELDKITITEDKEENKNIDYINLLLNANLNDYDFKEELIDSIGQYQMILIINGIEIPTELVNYRIKPRQIQNNVLYQVHLFIDDKLQKLGIGTNILLKTIQLYGNVYCGFGRMLNKNAAFSIFNKLSKINNIEVSHAKNKEQQNIGLIAKLK